LPDSLLSTCIDIGELGTSAGQVFVPAELSSHKQFYCSHFSNM